MIRGLVFLFTLGAAMSAEAVTIVAQGTYANNTSSSSMVVSPSSTMAAGSTGVLQIAADNAAATATTRPGSDTDSAGNKYLVRDTPMAGGALSNTEMAILLNFNRVIA
jgi:hypothetical protein